MPRFAPGIAIALALLIAVPLGAQAPATALPGWLAGAWVMESGAAWADEVWLPPRGGAMLGAARTGFGAELESWEQTRIVRKRDGSLSFYARPKGGTESEFPMVLAGPNAMEFANAANDYPQRIRYWREGQLLVAEISRIDGSDAMRWNYRPLAAE